MPIPATHTHKHISGLRSLCGPIVQSGPVVQQYRPLQLAVSQSSNAHKSNMFVATVFMVLCASPLFRCGDLWAVNNSIVNFVSDERIFPFRLSSPLVRSMLWPICCNNRIVDVAFSPSLWGQHIHTHTNSTFACIYSFLC